MKKIKKIQLILGLLAVVIISYILPVKALAKVDVTDPSSGYVNQNYNDRYKIQKIPLEDNNLYLSLDPYYRLGISDREKAKGSIAASHPNLFLQPNTNSINNVKDVNFFTSRKYGGYDSGAIYGTNFLIAEKKSGYAQGHKVWSHPLYVDNNNDYYINNQIQGLYSETKLYTDGKTTNGSGQSVPPRMKIGVEVKPVSNSLIRFTYTVENTSDEDLEFIPLQNIPLEISHIEKRTDPPVRPVIDLKMLGENEGISAEDNGYQLNYLFKNTPNGPDNFASFGVPRGYWLFIMPDATFGNREIDYDFYRKANWIYDPYKDRSVYGTGVEAEGYGPNEILKSKSNSDSPNNGIAIKWNEVTLKPGEYADFSYDVQMFSDFGINYLFHKKDKPEEKVYKAGETVVFQPSGSWINKERPLSEVLITTSIADGVTLKPNDEVLVKAMSTSGNGLETDIIKKVQVKDVYDKESQKLSVAISKQEMDKIKFDINSVGLEFNGLLNEDSRNKTVTQTANIRFTDEKTGEEYYRNQPIFILVDDTKFINPTNYELDVNKKVQYKEYFLDETVTYTVNVTNSNESTDDLSQAKIIDYMPEGLSKPTNIKLDNKTLSEENINWNDSEKELTLDLGKLSPGETKEVTYQATLESGKANDKKINRVTFTGDVAEDDAVSDEVEFLVKIKEKRKVSFDSMGGSPVDSIVVDNGDTVNEPISPKYPNRVFKGWYTTKEFTKLYDFSEPVIKDMTLYAKWQSSILDPTDNEHEVNTDKPNSSKEDLRIAYVSDFNFGTSENNAQAFTKKAMYDVIDSKGNKKVPSFVSVIDDRPDNPNKSAWSLRAKSSNFINNNGRTLNGASLILSDLNFQGEKKSPQLATGRLNISESSAKEIANSSNQPEGNSWSISLGKLEQEKVTGVSLEVPFGEYKDPTDYQSVIEWELVPKINGSGG